MRLFKSSCLLALLLLSSCGQAVAQCSEKPSAVDTYLRAHPGWLIVAVSDLPDDDKALWNSYHSGLCPGMAAVASDGADRDSYALALLRRSNGKLVEQLVLLNGSVEQLLVKPGEVVSPFVVYRIGPGNYVDHATGKKVSIAHDSIVYEKMESTSTQFYFVNGKLHSLLASE